MGRWSISSLSLASIFNSNLKGYFFWLKWLNGKYRTKCDQICKHGYMARWKVLRFLNMEGVLWPVFLNFVLGMGTICWAKLKLSCEVFYMTISQNILILGIYILLSNLCKSCDKCSLIDIPWVLVSYHHESFVHIMLFTAKCDIKINCCWVKLFMPTELWTTVKMIWLVESNY